MTNQTDQQQMCPGCSELAAIFTGIKQRSTAERQRIFCRQTAVAEAVGFSEQKNKLYGTYGPRTCCNMHNLLYVVRIIRVYINPGRAHQLVEEEAEKEDEDEEEQEEEEEEREEQEEEEARRFG